MTRADDVRSINCTSCGAGLNVLGGGRVTAHVCGYCGAELDAQDGYAVLRKFADLRRPDSPLAIGMSGQVQGVAFTVIGTLGMEERYGGRTWVWVDHQIFSPTHGYGYLTVEGGHLLFSRRMRRATKPAFLTSQTVERSNSPPIVRDDKRYYRYYDTSTSVITYAEGEFNWTPVIGARATVVSVLSDDAMVSFAETNTEREVEITTYLPPEVWASFGVTAPPLRSGQHPLQPFAALSVAPFLKWASAGAALICLALAGFFALQSGRVALPLATFGLNTLPVELPFEITVPGRLATMELGANVSNSWAFVEVALTDPEDEPVFVAGREIGYYFGRDSDGGWTEGSTRSRVTFRPEMAGVYTLELSVDSTGIEGAGGTNPSNLSVAVTEDLPGPLWMLLAAGVFAVTAAVPFARAALHKRRKWAGSDWVEDDDDD